MAFLTTCDRCGKQSKAQGTMHGGNIQLPKGWMYWGPPQLTSPAGMALQPPAKKDLCFDCLKDLYRWFNDTPNLSVSINTEERNGAWPASPIGAAIADIKPSHTTSKPINEQGVALKDSRKTLMEDA